MNRNNRLNSVDKKGRVAFPSSLRKVFSKDGKGKVVLTTGFDPCIYVFTEYEWKITKEKFRAWGKGDTLKRKIEREFIGMADEEVEFDNHGRILISGPLMEYAGIKDKCLFVRMTRWIEIWNPEKYREYQNGILEMVRDGKIETDGFPI